MRVFEFRDDYNIERIKQILAKNRYELLILTILFILFEYELRSL